MKYLCRISGTNTFFKNS